MFMYILIGIPDISFLIRCIFMVYTRWKPKQVVEWVSSLDGGVYERFATPCFGGMSGKQLATEWLGKSPFKVLLSNLYILMSTYQLIYVYIHTYI